MITEVFVESVLIAYAQTALWSSTDDNGESLDALHDVDDLAPDTVTAMAQDVADFMQANADDLDGLSAETIGQNFWLTRNRHGAGFWDLGLGDRGDRLTRMAHPYGSSDLYIGDDGLIYAS